MNQTFTQQNDNGVIKPPTMKQLIAKKSMHKTPKRHGVSKMSKHDVRKA